MNLVLEPPAQVAYFTDMRRTLDDIGIDPCDYDWYISDLETNVAVPQLGNGDRWVQGHTLAQILAIPSLQFIWAVLSGFAVGEAGREVESPPIADGNRRYWQPPEVSPQLLGACIEIVCWDSSATILIGLNHEQATRYLRYNPLAKPLSNMWHSSAV